MALDEATAALLAQLAAPGRPPLHSIEPAQARVAGSLLNALIGPGPEMSSVSQVSLTTKEGESFSVRILVPVPDPVAVIVYFHGGGWVLGDIDQFDTLGRQLAERSRCTVVLVDYRKAPEHPYPAAVEDAWQALNWVAQHYTGYRGERLPLIVAGDSAGGNLAAIMAHRARDRAGPRVSLQILVYPATDADVDTESYRDPRNQLLIDRDTMIWFWSHYAPPERRAEAEVSPLRARSLAGLPPAVVLAAEYDVLRSEVEAYADALAAAGVTVDLHMFAGQAHGFFTMANILPGSAQGLDYIATAITRHLSAISMRQGTSG